jgi:uncharacterized protein (TIGR02757 family)
VDARAIKYRFGDAEFFDWLDELADRYERPEFIQNDPIQVPHRFSKKQDVEIAGFFASLFAWGQRKTIINKANELMKRMDDAPYDFLLNSNDEEWAVFRGFVHRTLNEDDVMGLMGFLKNWYSQHESLESAFLMDDKVNWSMQNALKLFRNRVKSSDCLLARTWKHVPSVESGSTCKRLVMYLRWMVRSAERGVDFGIWREIPANGLLLPLDVHVSRVAVEMDLLKQKNGYRWGDVEELGDRLSERGCTDVGKYDFALFGLAVNLV